MTQHTPVVLRCQSSTLMTINSRMLLIALTLLTGACSDAATRVAYDIQSGTKKLGSAEGARVQIRHAPSRWPEGCAGAYTLHIGKGSAAAKGNNNFRTNPGSESLLVRCYNSGGNAHAWSTTYHLRFVDVPETVEIEKHGGDPTVIDVERKAGRPTVVGLH
jgi:hypothetical protein